MSGNTTAYDYSTYYEEETDGYAPTEFEDVSNFGKVFLPTLFSLVFVLGFAGNGLVVCVLVRFRNQTNLTDMCLFNLALSDLLFLLTLPFYADYSRVGQWAFGDFMCRFASICHNTGFFSSIFFMVVMTLDRYVVIMHALTVARYRTLRAGIVVTIFVWMLSFSVSLPAFLFTKVTNESDGVACSYCPESDAWKRYDVFAPNILGLVLPMLVMVVCYCRIIPTLVNMKSTKKHRVVKLIISIVVSFFIFWAPYYISLFLNFLKDGGKLKGDPETLEKNLRLSITVTEAFAYCHCCLNPIIYGFMGQKFMRRVLQLLKGWLPWIRLPSSSYFSESSYRRASAMSRSSDVTSTVIN